MLVRGYRDGVLVDIFDIDECTYTGKDMGERSITATVNWPSPIDLQIGDYIDLDMQSLERKGSLCGHVTTERFYIYTMPTIKKSARPMSDGKGFEHNITFYPAQYELGLVQMRDFGGVDNADSLIYTGFDTVNLYCGAYELMEYIMRVLKIAYHDEEGKGLWNYYIANSVNELQNPALERFAMNFSGNTVMDALLKLSDKDGINTTFFINGRTIYVGFKRPYFCRVTDDGTIDGELETQMFSFKYGMTSNKDIAINYGGLYEITKTTGNESPITKLFAYGSSRNLNRYYCSDRIASGRYVNRLMLPSFSNDGKTDFIVSEDAIATYGIREGSKQFEDIYPTIQYMTYGDIRQIKYCIKIKASGLYESQDTYPVARVQCYRVIESSETVGVNTLVEAAPPHDLAIYVHAVDKIVKVVLCGGRTDDEAIQKQIARDVVVPTLTKNSNDYIPGSCFLVHDDNFSDAHTSHLCKRSDWFYNVHQSGVISGYTTEQEAEIKNHQINYTDTFWLTDLYIFTGYDQTYFDRTGYSAWAYPKLNGNYVTQTGDAAHDSLTVNEIVAVEPIIIEDTSANIVGADIDKRQKTFDIYLRDIGFKIDEQTDFGEKVFIQNGNLSVSIIDGNLAGQEFECSGVITDSQWSCICAFQEDGSLNDEFFIKSEHNGSDIPNKAFALGAIWRIRCNRTNLEEPDYANLNIALPNIQIQAKPGDHIVLLNLFMPDIYIHAAEQRLLREARKYLYSNDRGEINYSVTLDPVRMHQIPNYALQMREGLNIRLMDDDLSIVTKNRVTNLFEGPLLTNVSMYETTYDSTPTVDYYYTIQNRDYYYLRDHVINYITFGNNQYIDGAPCTLIFKEEKGGFSADSGKWKGKLYGVMSHEDAVKDTSLNEIFAKDGKMKIRILKRVRLANGTFYEPLESYITVKVTNLRRTISGSGALTDNFVADFEKNNMDSSISHVYQDGNDSIIYGVCEYDMRTAVPYDKTVYTPNTHLVPEGHKVYVSSRALIEFSQNKHYDVVLELNNTRLLNTYSDGQPKFLLINGLSGEALTYEPECTFGFDDLGDGWLRFSFHFDLDSSFNDSQDYYPSVVYTSDNNTEYVSIRLISVTESDAEGYKDLNYADMTLQEISIKITNSNNNVRPIKEITATLSEQSNASAWSTLRNAIDETRKDSDENARVSQEIINTARKYRRELLGLRNAIFDPDGTCTDTFLQVMMMQVGADSMNYYLEKTFVGADGEYHNCLLYDNFIDKSVHFKVNYEDVLHHVVYTDQGGAWRIPRGIDVQLDGVSTYFVSIKCREYGNEGEWVCTTKQYAVNEEDGYWYFNWGILVVDSTGKYSITETRGNAYMYGDNVICGKISTMAKNSWFDLTKGEFVLGERTDGTAALSFKDNKLIIGGVPSEKEIEDILSSLGLLSESLSSLDYLKNAIGDGSTIATGGLLMSNLLMLKDESNKIIAGMSGLTDSGQSTQYQESEGVAMWSGGSYEAALENASYVGNPVYSQLPVLLTKTGISSRIGAFKVLSKDTIAIDGGNGNRIVLCSGPEPYIDIIRGGIKRTSITSAELSTKENDLQVVNLTYSSINLPIYTLGEPVDGVVSTISLKAGMYNLSFKEEAVNVRVDFSPYYKGDALGDINISFDVALGDTIISNVKTKIVGNNGESAVEKYYSSFSKLNPPSSIPGGSKELKIINTKITSTSGKPLYCTVLGFDIGYGDSDNEWKSYSAVTFSNVGNSDVNIVAANGIQVSSINGMIQMLNGEEHPVVKMVGLPEYNDNLEKNTLCTLDIGNGVKHLVLTGGE
jgi:hypothetical protein